MLTRMTDEGWQPVLDPFRARRSRRGARGRDDRRFLEALHGCSVHSITRHPGGRCRRRSGTGTASGSALPAPEPGGGVRGLLRRAGRNEPHRASGADVRFHRRARPRLGGGRRRGREDQALGRSRGGSSTTIHLKVDLAGGLPLAFHLAAGEAGDGRRFEPPLDLGPEIAPRAAVADKGCDAKHNRAAAGGRARGASAR